ncbi:flagellar hook protein FlgE [Cohaesibacter celericrescens]|uniref:Flagellar hook protein FlgE n=1 Tax=Cohaesibacter celericrescens TaxID=2067669 RepID=A0A2N5XWN6_9HYPH|nr:flagellar hook protein FlgE [Cohaesibacter celericrescens]PLW75519.1 flagellar hook protein FlgE [Cohaesibacter celericrescens]PLW78926.1 flagellar hook protein FlgE [Cohaesibacter celericrescens]
MSLYGVMRSSVSGMSAQSSKLSAVSDNIINSATVGYKRVETEFSSITMPSGSGTYNSGAVEARSRYAISTAGNLDFTTSVTDLAIEGNGFFVVADSDGTPALTRAGRFVADDTGDLINTAGYYLQGYDLGTGGVPAVVANSMAGMTTVNVAQMQLDADPTTAGSMGGNLPSNATAVLAGSWPSDNVAGSDFTAKTSMVTYDNLGNEVTVDIYFTKKSASPASSVWEVSVFNQADADPATGGFPYAAAPTSPLGTPYTNPLSTTDLTFDNTTGDITGTDFVLFDIPDGQTGVNFSLSEMTQLAKEFGSVNPEMNGNPPQAVESISIDSDGTLYAVYENGNREARFKIPLANVASPDNLDPMGGEVFRTSSDSGDVVVGFAGENGLGTMRSMAIENSNVDLATELTNMVVAQRSFSANSKVFQTGSDLLTEVVNLSR